MSSSTSPGRQQSSATPDIINELLGADWLVVLLAANANLRL